MRNLILLSLFSLVIVNCYSQKEETPTAKALFNNCIQFYENHPNFSIDLKYTLFRGKESPITIDSYTGSFKTSDNNSYLKINETEFLINRGKFLKVNHEQKAILFQESEITKAMNSPIEISQYLKNFSEQEVYLENGDWVCKLSTPLITQLPYGTIWIYIDMETYAIKKQIMELTAPKGFKDEKGEYTMDLKYLEIKLTDLSLEVNSSNNLNFEKFLTANNGKYQVTNAYKDYELYVSEN